MGNNVSAEHIGTLLKNSERRMFALLREIVEMNSHTHNKEGTDRVGRRLAQELSRIGMEVRIKKNPELGNHIAAYSPAAHGEGSDILLCGHMDTVFPPEHAFQKWQEDDEFAYGPGVIDMKGGLVTALNALIALGEADVLEHMPIVFILNSDEEIGSPSSQQFIRETAQKSCCGFVFECSGTQGETVTGRKGRTGYRLEISGKAGHAGADAQKCSAILELAHKTIALEGLNHQTPGTSVNVGLVRGGIGPNTIAAEASALVDTRYSNQDQSLVLERAVHEIADTCTVPGTTCKLGLVSQRPCMEQTAKNKKLFQIVAEFADRHDIPIKEQFRGGVSDANFIAAAGIPVLDGMGPSGDFDHSDKEYMIKSSFYSRSLLTALTLLECAERIQHGKLMS